MKTFCETCGSKDILQEATIMLNPNSIELPTTQSVMRDIEWMDFYYCNDCKDVVQTVELED